MGYNVSFVGGDIFVGGSKEYVPEDIAALSVFSFARCFGFILQGELVSAFVESFLVRRGDVECRVSFLLPGLLLVD